jgi:hypothetical protein
MRGFNPVEFREADIEEAWLWLQLLSLMNRFQSITCLSHDLRFRLLLKRG